MYVRKTLGDAPVPNIAQQFIQMHGNTQINPNARIEDVVNSAGFGVMCAQVMKTCPDGSLVGYDLKVKDRCVYLPCPSSGANGYEQDRMLKEPSKWPKLSESDWEILKIYGVWLGGAAVLAYMLFKK